MASQIYENHDEVLIAIRRVQKFLDTHFITEVCRGDKTFGCASCQAVGIHDDLEMLAQEIEDDQVRPSPPDHPTEETVRK